MKLNGGTFQPASGTWSWSQDLDLAVGANTITAQATDAAGNSAQVSVSLTYQPITLMSNIDVGSDNLYEVDVLAAGKLVYTDREYEFTDVPAFLTGEEFIRTANDDKHETADDYLTFDLDASARVYVLFDDRAQALPAWLDDGSWTLDSATVDTSDVPRRIYFKDFSAGAVHLGGNAMPPMSGAKSNYNVVIVPSAP